MKINNVYVGNNIEVLKTFPDNSIDSVVTDPPYGLGKEPNAIEVLQSWITKGYHEIKGKGFMGKEWDAFVPQPNFWKEIYRVLKPGGYVLSFAGTRTYDWMVMAVRLAGFEIRDMIAWLYGSGFPKSLDISKAIDKSMGTKREVIGKAKGVGSNNTNSMENGLGGKQEFANEYDITEPSTIETKQWEGWGTALKPALEPIVMARKPLDGTVAQNVLKHGVGGINIDECRVPTDEVLQPSTSTKMKYGGNSFYESSTMNDPNWVQNPNGRFPANVIHDGSDEVVSLFPKTGPTKPHGGDGKKLDTQNMGWGFKRMPSKLEDNGGSAARFFYVAKPSQKERNFGLYDFKDDIITDGRTKPIDNAFNRGETKRKNIHPTVKPINLMRYLVRLVTPKNGVCLDPYLGSGTTAIACEMEKISWIGIELIPEYAEIAKARIAAVKDYEATLNTKLLSKKVLKKIKKKN